MYQARGCLSYALSSLEMINQYIIFRDSKGSRGRTKEDSPKSERQCLECLDADSEKVMQVVSMVVTSCL